MDTLIARLRTKPLPVRRRIATATAGAVTVLVGAVWLTASMALGSFAVFGSAAPAQQNVSLNPSQNLAGVAAAGAPASAKKESPASDPSLTVVETSNTSTFAPAAAERTVIPF